MARFHRAGRGAAALVLVALALASCGGAEPLGDAAQEQIDDAGSQATEALAAVDSLTERLSVLEDELAGVTLERKRLSEQLDEMASTLALQLKRLEKKLAAAKGSAAAAAASADSALAAAQEAARNLTVLERRFDYHLKNGG